MTPLRHLLIATRNRHKLDEIRAIFAFKHLEISSALDVPHVPDVEETGATFEENAMLKARALAAATGQWALGDDSGLEVDALDGAPGVYSARFAGEPANYAANNEKLLRLLNGVTHRRARFRTVLALASPTGECYTVEGRCEGRIIEELTTQEIARVVGKIRDSGAEAVAICLLHSYANPSHEETLAKALALAMPHVPVSLSSHVSPMIGEYERCSTTCATC